MRSKQEIKMRLISMFNTKSISAAFISAMVLAAVSFGQTPAQTPPAPGNPRAIKLPSVSESRLKNDLPVVVVQRKNVPLVTVSLLIRAGANREDDRMGGLAEMTSSLLTKGTKTRSATDIAEQIEFLGGEIRSGAEWNSSELWLNILSSNLEKALDIMADAVINPAFSDAEIELLRQQALDSLSIQLKQPGTLADYAAAQITFGEHESDGTLESVSRIDRDGIKKFYDMFYGPENAVLIFTGDISDKEAFALAEKFFGKWKKAERKEAATNEVKITRSPAGPGDKSNVVNRVLVIDLPELGQASVNYVKKTRFGRGDLNDYYTSSVLNSVLGGGYSARLNQEIRIKRGLSYGARSEFGYRPAATNFSAGTQTKNESAALVAELIVAEIDKLVKQKVSADELGPRKAVLTGSFGRRLATNNSLANLIRDQYLFGLSIDQLGSYPEAVGLVDDARISAFSAANLLGGDIIIVGDAKMFLDDLIKSFPDREIEVINIDDLDLNERNLRKAPRPAPSPMPAKPAARGKSDADRSKPDPKP